MASIRSIRSMALRLSRDYVLSIAFWMPLSLLVGWQQFTLERAQFPVVLSEVLLIYAARYLSVALLTPLVFRVVSRWPVSSPSAPYRLAGYLIAFVPFSIAFAMIRWVLLPPWRAETLAFGPRTLPMLWELTYSTFADVLLLYLGVVITAHAYAYFVLGQRQEIDRLKLRQSLAHSELQALRSQLQPHFLFNTLQGIATLIDSNRKDAQRALLTLAGLLRTVLKHGTADLVSLRDELDFVRAYLELEQLRLGARLEVAWKIAPEAEVAFIPQLLLQPLIENAILHGVAGSSMPGWIKIGAIVRDGRLIVHIANSVNEISAAGHGLGLTNVRARMTHLYGQDASFSFDRAAFSAQARIELPAFTTDEAIASHFVHE